MPTDQQGHHSLEGDPRENVELRLLLEGIYQLYGYDFRNYSPSSIRRRVWHRIQLEGLSTISALQEKVLHDRDVMRRLFADFTIHVTEMFRDPPFFAAVRQQVIPLLKGYPYIRIWHAGCSTGEEPLSMAILLEEAGLLERTRIYATDINYEALHKALDRTYPIERIQMYTRNYHLAGGTRSFSEYYTVTEQEVEFHAFLTQNIVFARHNLVTDKSFNEFHMIICRNVLIYFDLALQRRVHELFFESLAPDGFLCIGNKEATIREYGNKYDVFDDYTKILRRR